MSNIEDIIVTARKMSQDGVGGGSRPVWSITAVYTDRTTGTSRQLTNTDFQQTLRRLGNEDSVRIDVETDGKKIPVAISGLQGRDVQAAFSNFLGLITSTLDGSLAESVAQIKNAGERSRLQSYISELAGDLDSIANHSNYISIEGVSGLGDSVYAEYRGRLTPGGIDVDGDGQPNQRHIIAVNPDKIGSGRNQRLDATLVHELFHILQDENSVHVDYAKFGTNEANHTNAFDKAATKLVKLADGKSLMVSSETSTSNILGVEGTTGSDVLGFQSGFRGAFAEGFSGNDTLIFPFSSSVLDGGAGNDHYVIEGGTGLSAVFDDSGYDILDFGAHVSRNQLVVRIDSGWIELGIKDSGTQNVTTSDLNRVVVIPEFRNELNQIEEVRIGGQALSLASLVSEANSAPFFLNNPEFHMPSTYRGGFVDLLYGKDLDNEAFSFSVASVHGYGSSSGWWISGNQLFSGATAPRFGTQSTITLRVSDGQKYTDLEAIIRWTPASDLSTDSPVQNESSIYHALSYSYLHFKDSNFNFELLSKL